MPRCQITSAVLVFILLAGSVCTAGAEQAGHQGVQFHCSAQDRARIRVEMTALFKSLFISERYINSRDVPDQDLLVYTLATPADDTGTLDFVHRPEYWIYDQPVRIYGKRHRPKTVSTVSLKEILLALLQHGRLTDFSGRHCSVSSLVDHLQLRQNIVAWAERVQWHWPGGERSRWNSAFWDDKGVRHPKQLFEAFEDAFVNQDKYSIGCYAAVKMTYAFSMMDFYRRVKRNDAAFVKVKAAIRSGARPLAGIEPSAMWRFEVNDDPPDASMTGKLLYLQQGVGDRNFVPGDWVYFVNTDPASKNKTGYEGSNSIYLGRGWFSDFYNDAEHHYTFEQKLDEVYQWRHGVFSQSKDYEKAEYLSQAKLNALATSIQRGGVIVPVRAVPLLFD